MKEKIKTLTNWLTNEFGNKVTDFNFEQVATKYVEQGGWNDNKSFKQVCSDIIPFMGYGLARKKF